MEECALIVYLYHRCAGCLGYKNMQSSPALLSYWSCSCTAADGAQLAMLQTCTSSQVAAYQTARSAWARGRDWRLCRPPLLTAMTLLRTTGAALSLLVREWGAFLGSAVSGVFGPPLQAFLSAARAVKEFVVPVLRVDKPSLCPAVFDLALDPTFILRPYNLSVYSSKRWHMRKLCSLKYMWLGRFAGYWEFHAGLGLQSEELMHLVWNRLPRWL